MRFNNESDLQTEIADDVTPLVYLHLMIDIDQITIETNRCIHLYFFSLTLINIILIIIIIITIIIMMMVIIVINNKLKFVKI